jgi:hypothetical protein
MFQVEMMVNRSWKHTQDLGDLYDFGRLNHDGVRKSLKKYDKTFAADRPNLQAQYFEELKKQYKFFNFREDLKELLFQCAVWWIPDEADKLHGLKSAPSLFPFPHGLRQMFGGAAAARALSLQDDEMDLPLPESTMGTALIGSAIHGTCIASRIVGTLSLPALGSHQFTG